MEFIIDFDAITNSTKKSIPGIKQMVEYIRCVSSNSM